MVAWLMCWYMSMSDQRTGTGATNPTLTPTIPVRWYASCGGSAAPPPTVSPDPSGRFGGLVERPACRSTREALVCSHSAIFSSPLSSGSPTSKHVETQRPQ